MRISDYLPNLYSRNVDMLNIIYSEEAELESNLKKDIEDSFKNTYIVTANENGIAEFEKLYGIKPSSTDSIDFRRARVLNRILRKIPFTEKFLQQKLNEILGENNWTYTIDYANYTLVINSIIPGRAWYNELITFLDGIIPCNIDWSVVVYAASWGIIDNSFSTWEEIYDTEMTWQELMDAEWMT